MKLRAKPMESIRHGIRRAAHAAWLEQFEANPRNSLSNRVLTLLNGVEAEHARDNRGKWPTPKMTALYIRQIKEGLEATKQREAHL